MAQRSDATAPDASPGVAAGEEFSGEDLVAAMDTAARSLLERGNVDEAAGSIVAGAVAVVPPATGAGISLVQRGGKVTAEAPSSAVAGELDRLQNELGEGPCLEAIHEETRIEVTDTAAPGQRWPQWAAAAREHGVGSILCLQLFARNGSAGALNLYAPTPHAFDADAQHLAGLFASHAAVTLYGARQVAALNRALASRDEIGQAKGILMERFAMSPEQAFELLVRSSQDTNVKLVSVARFLVDEAYDRAGRSTPKAVDPA